MALMFDTIMELPLFKGIGEDQLSQLLEKTSIEFLKFKDGEIIAQAGQPVASVDFIIGGAVKNVYTLKNYPIEIHETIGKGGMIGALRLFGLHTNYGADCFAIGEVSIMRIEKSQYMNILQSDRIYILNFVNYLSAAAQKSQMLMLDQKTPGVARDLHSLAYSVASRLAKCVKIVASDEALASYCGVEVGEIRKFREKNKGENSTFIN